jgi:DNA-binding CsgD family transcriptional regulator
MNEAELIGRIYESSEGDSQDFGGLFRVLGETLGAVSGHHFVLEENAAPETHDFGSDPAAFARYIDEFQAVDPRLRIAQQNPHRIFSDVDVIDASSFERAPIYAELLRSVNLRYSLFFASPVQPGLVLAQALMRPKKLSHFGEEEKRRLERILPHLRRAVRLRWNLLRLHQPLSDLQQSIDRLPSPTLILDASGRPLCMNQRVRRLLDERDGLVLRGGRLDATSPTASRALSAALTETLRLGTPAALRSLHTVSPPSVVQVHRDGGRVLSLIFLPFGVAHHPVLNDVPQARALVVIHDPDRALRLNPALIAKVHGLTPTEAALAAALAEGETPASIARERGSSEQTVRTHIKRILEKTETTRQVDRVRLLLAGGAMHLGGSDGEP